MATFFENFFFHDWKIFLPGLYFSNKNSNGSITTTLKTTPGIFFEKNVKKFDLEQKNFTFFGKKIDLKISV